MCGIAGYISDRGYDPHVLEAMTRALRHRGPDDEGYFRKGPVHLGHRRLSVVDVAGSRQPLFNEDGSVVVVFNGEIYNFRSMREELIALGHVFRTQGDTEVLVHAYEQYGEDMLRRLQGMFAFAIWDSNREQLLIARDPIGIKPLYYYWDGSVFAFASELKTLLLHPDVKREIDLEAVNLFLECQYIPAPRSIYRHIRKLRPAHAAVFHGKGLRELSYWVPDYLNKLDLTEGEAVDWVERELKNSVRSMLISEVPLGAFVSGGIDSGLIAAMMRDCLGKPVETFNLGFSGDAAQSEHEEAAAVARHIGSHHHCLMIEPKSVLDALDHWVDVFDEPFGDQAALPTMLLSGFARREVTVVLTGEGADEVFGGYSNYQKRVKEERITRILGAPGSPFPAMIRRLPTVARRDRLLKAIARPLAERYVTIPNVFDEAVRPDVYSAAFRQATHERMASYAADYFNECNSRHYIDRIMYVDSRLWLPDDLLTKVDRATMAHSLEARVPYLDHRFIDACARLDPLWKQHGNTRKYVLKRVAEKYLPWNIVHRPKQGFVMPLREWLRADLKQHVAANLGAGGLAARNIFQPRALERLQRQHNEGQKDHSGRLWVLLVLELWFKRYEPGFAL